MDSGLVQQTYKGYNSHQWHTIVRKPKTNLVHSKAVRKTLVTIVLNILSTMFYSKTIKNLASAKMTVSDSVESVAQTRWGGAGSARRPPLNPPL